MTGIPPSAPLVIVVGDGLIGLASAAALAERGARVRLVGAAAPGQASYAAAGMLAPGVERSDGAAHRFAVRARDRYPTYLAWLRERTGVEVPLNRRGVLQVALDEREAALLADERAGDAEWLDAGAVAAEEPALAHAVGAVRHPDDGAVDNRRLLAALRALVDADPRVERVAAPAVALEVADRAAVVRTADGAAHRGERVVLAAGAWTPGLAGLPRRLPIEPVRGQMLALAATPLRHVVYGAGGYCVPRSDRTLVGSTMERVAFDAGTTAEGLARVRAVGDAVCPALAGAAVVEAWAGLRPVTPDGLPIIGADPAAPALVYACGHSRNGVLLAPLTGDCVAALALGEEEPADLAPFVVTRFEHAIA